MRDILFAAEEDAKQLESNILMTTSVRQRMEYIDIENVSSKADIAIGDFVLKVTMILKKLSGHPRHFALS